MLKRLLRQISTIAVLSLGLSAAHAEEPEKLRIAGILSAGLEAPWETSFALSMERVIAAQPHGLDIEINYTESVYSDAEEVFRAYAQSGNYDILFGNSAYSDAVEALQEEFPEILFVVSGSGNRALGGNAYWAFIHGHEPAFVMGEMAGLLSETGTVGIVSSFPADDTNDQINAFVAGARSIRPDTDVKLTFIRSWFDPAKSNEAASAQIAAGADLIYQMSGAFELCEQREIGCFGNYMDMSAYAPNSVAASALVKWDPVINWVIDEWWAFKTEGTPYDAPMEPRWFTWAEGSGDLVISPAWFERLTPEDRARIETSIAQIESGATTVPLDLSDPTSN